MPMSKRVECETLWILASHAGERLSVSQLESKFKEARERARVRARERELKWPIKRYPPVTNAEVKTALKNITVLDNVKCKDNQYRRKPIIMPMPPLQVAISKTTIPRPKLPKVNREDGVIQCIGRATEAPTTKDISLEVGWSSREVSGICRHLENDGFLNRGKPTTMVFLFAPIIGENVHSGNYDLAKSLYDRLRRIVAQFDLKDPRLVVSVSKFLSGILGQKKYAKYRKTINSYRGDLIGIIRQAENKSDVYEFLGFKRYPRDVTTWLSAV